MGLENFNGEYLVDPATQMDIPNLVRMRIYLQNHMEEMNNLIFRYNDEWKKSLPALYNTRLNESNALIIKATEITTNEVVGMMVGTIHEHLQFTSERSVKIDDVWVDADHRKKGICSQMLSYLKDRFAEEGISHFTLNYVVNNNDAAQTWKALGFSPTIIHCVAEMIR